MNKEKLTVERDSKGTVTYSNSKGQLHNPNGPALVYVDGEKEHYINNQLHNENGPAIVCANGDKFYFINGELHNPNGPALVYVDGYKAYYINGKPLTKTEFAAWQAEQIAEQIAALHNKTATIDGIKYKLTAK
jgi:hypothetical protein